MAKCIGDLVEKRFGNLVVKEFVGKDKYYNKLWRCECDCKNMVVVRQGHLMSGHTTSCGCNKLQLDNLKDKQFGNLVVIERADDYITPSNGKHYVQWLCQCGCGKRTVVLASNLKSGSVVSCGCMNPHKLDDLSQRYFGDWFVIEQTDSYVNPSGRKLIQYKCRCSCGTYKNVLANTLRSGESTSCGCKVNSKGERIVSKWLALHDYSFESHKSFDDCLSDIGCKLNFDFYLPDENVLIECNGIQYYEPIEFFGGDDQYKSQCRHDELKLEYARKNGFRYLVLDCRRNALKHINQKLDDFLIKS